MILPNEFVNQAKGLIDPRNSPTEVDCRSAISRAYYFLFHESFEHLKKKYDYVIVKSIEEHFEKNGEKDKIDHAKLKKLETAYLLKLKVNMHGTIPNVLHRLGKHSYGSDFDGFREDRNDADYDLSKTLPLPEDIQSKVDEIEKLARSITVI